jgi:hypothetical protein
MFPNQGAYIMVTVPGLYFKKEFDISDSVYMFHSKSAGFEPYTILLAFVKSPYSFNTVNPALSISAAT